MSDTTPAAPAPLPPDMEHDVGKPDNREALPSLRAGWQQAMTGDTHPIETLWDGLEWDNTPSATIDIDE